MEPILQLFQQCGVKWEENSLFVKIHIPQSHTLNKTNFSLTIEDLSYRLSKMDIIYPLCVYSSGNNPAARLNFQQGMGGPIDGQDYIMFVFVARSELQTYKRRWPNQILVELPFASDDAHWKDISRQIIKVFGQTLGTDYVFMIEDNLYCAYKANEEKFEPTTLLEYFQALQKGAESGAPLIGARTTGLGSLEAGIKDNEWENGFVQSSFLVKSDVDVQFQSPGTNSDADEGLSLFNRDCNNIGIVQQNQKFLLQCGYTISDPITGTEYRAPEFIPINRVEPEFSYGNNLRAKVLSNEVVLDKKLSDGTRYARSFVVVADETACIALIAKNEQIEQLEVGKNYFIRNSYMTMYKGFMRMEIDEWGKIEEYDGEITPKQKQKCMSLIEYELVGEQDNARGGRGDKKDDKDDNEDD
jgi:hypothetical protein